MKADVSSHALSSDGDVFANKSYTAERQRCFSTGFSNNRKAALLK